MKLKHYSIIVFTCGILCITMPYSIARYNNQIEPWPADTISGVANYYPGGIFGRGLIIIL